MTELPDSLSGSLLRSSLVGGVVEAVSHLGFTARASRQVAGREHFPARIPGQAPEKGRRLKNIPQRTYPGRHRAKGG